MNATATLELTNLSRSKRLSAKLNEDLTLHHSVGQTVEHFLGSVGIRDTGKTWNAISRGVRLDSKSKLLDLPEADTDWMIIPEVPGQIGSSG